MLSGDVIHEIATKVDFGFVDIVSAFCNRQERATSVAELSFRITRIEPEGEKIIDSIDADYVNANIPIIDI